MFDTIRIGIAEVDLDVEILLQRGWSIREDGKRDAEGRLKNYVNLRYQQANASPHWLKYSPAKGLLIVEASLPKICFASVNHKLLAPRDVPATLAELSNRVSDLTGRPVDCAEGYIWGQLDAVFSWCAVWNGENHVGDYIHALSKLELTRHSRVLYDGTVLWENGWRRIQSYDKGKECGLSEAEGLLRFEVQMKKPKADLQRIAKIESLRVKDVLTWETARAVLNHYLVALGAQFPIYASEQRTRELIRARRVKEAQRILGFLALREACSRAELVSATSARTYARNLKEIREAGFSLAVSQRENLPPLSLPADYTGEPGVLSEIGDKGVTVTLPSSRHF